MLSIKLHRGRSAAVLAAFSCVGMIAACGGGGGNDNSASGGGGAEKPITLKFADILPENHYIAKGFNKPFIDHVSTESKDKGCPITIDWFSDAQLGKAADQLDNLNSGVFQIGSVSSNYNSDQMPLGNVFNLPRMAPNAKILANAYYDLSQDKNSALYKYDFARNTAVPIGTFALPLYQFVTSKPIDGVNALKGLNIRSGGGVQDVVVKALGANPVQLTTNEQYEGLQRGIIDGGIFNLPSLISNRTFEVTKYFTTNANVASFDEALVVQQSAWDGLSKCQQGVLHSAGHEATTEFADSLEATVTDTIKQLKDKGLTAVEFSDSDLKTLDKALAGVPDSWIKSVPDAAKPKQALQEAQAAIKKNS